MIRLVFGARADVAIRVAECESHLWRYAIGAAGEKGLWQFHPQHADVLDWGRLFNPLYSTQVAWRWSDHGRDFSPTWTCATNLRIP